MFLFYVLSFFKKRDTTQGWTLFKEIRYLCRLCILELKNGQLVIEILLKRSFANRNCKAQIPKAFIQFISCKKYILCLEKINFQIFGATFWEIWLNFRLALGLQVLNFLVQYPSFFDTKHEFQASKF